MFSVLILWHTTVLVGIFYISKCKFLFSSFFLKSEYNIWEDMREWIPCKKSISQYQELFYTSSHLLKIVDGNRYDRWTLINQRV